MKKPIKHIDDLATGLKDVKILLKIDEVKGNGEYAVSDSTGEALLVLTSTELKRDVFYWVLVMEVVPKGHLLQIFASEVQPMIVEENAPVGHIPLHPKPAGPHVQGAHAFGQQYSHAGPSAHVPGGYAHRRSSGGGAHGPHGGGFRGGSRGGSHDGGQGGYRRSSHDGGYGQRGQAGGFRASGGGAYHGAVAPAMMPYQPGQQPQQPQQIVYAVAPQQQGADFGGVYGYGGAQQYSGQQGGDQARCAPQGQQQQGSAMGYGY